MGTNQESQVALHLEFREGQEENLAWMEDNSQKESKMSLTL